MTTDTSSNETPNPGSDAAIDQGCLCPVLDNSHGAGWPGKDGVPQFWVSSNCPLHAMEYDIEDSA